MQLIIALSMVEHDKYIIRTYNTTYVHTYTYIDGLHTQILYIFTLKMLSHLFKFTPTQWQRSLIVRIFV